MTKDLHLLVFAVKGSSNQFHQIMPLYCKYIEYSYICDCKRRRQKAKEEKREFSAHPVLPFQY